MNITIERKKGELNSFPKSWQQQQNPGINNPIKPFEDKAPTVSNPKFDIALEKERLIREPTAKEDRSDNQ